MSSNEAQLSVHLKVPSLLMTTTFNNELLEHFQSTIRI